MAFVHGKNTVVMIDDAAGTPRDLSQYITSSSLNLLVESAETTTYGKNSKTRIVGLKDSSFTMQGNFDNTATTGPDTVLWALYGVGPFTVDFRPQGSTTGNTKYTVEAILTSYDTQAPVDGVVAWSASFDSSGDVTRAIL